MKKFKILTKPTRLDELESNEWYEDFNNAWELKAERIRVRERKSQERKH